MPVSNKKSTVKVLTTLIFLAFITWHHLKPKAEKAKKQKQKQNPITVKISLLLTRTNFIDLYC